METTSYHSYLRVRGGDLLHLGPVPLIVDELGGAGVVLLGLVSAGQGRVGGELLPQAVHQLLKSGPLRHRASVKLALLGHLGNQNLHEVDLARAAQ